MNIREFTFNLIKLYEEMADTFSAHQAQTGLSCLKNCGRCCLNPDIEASPLEMFPLALKIYDEGVLDEWLTKLEQNTRPHCVLYVATGGEGEGRCGSYSERPAVCRMFGVAGTFDKHHVGRLSICKYIKETILTTPEVSAATPFIPEWSSKLMALDPELTQRKLPINSAIKEALQRIALYAQYHQL